LQFLARAKPGISLLTACNPKPAMPKRIMRISPASPEHSTIAVADT